MPTTVDDYSVATDENDDLGPGSTFAPLYPHRTYLDYNDKDYQKWLRKQDPETRKRLEKKYKSLEIYNRGTHKNRSFNYRSIQRRIEDWGHCHAIACQLELSSWQQKALWHIVDPLDLREFKKFDRNDGTGTRKLALIAYCVAIHLHNDSHTDKKYKYYPGEEISEEPKYDSLWRPCTGLRDRSYLFKKFAEDLGFEDRVVISCFEKLRFKIQQRYPNKDERRLSTLVLEDSDCWPEYINS